MVYELRNRSVGSISFLTSPILHLFMFVANLLHPYRLPILFFIFILIALSLWQAELTVRSAQIPQPTSFPVDPSVVARSAAQVEDADQHDSSDAPPIKPSDHATLLDRRLAALNERYAASPGKRNRNHARRKRKRDEQILVEGHSATPVVLKKLSSLAEPLYTKLASDRLPTTSCGYTALPLSLEAKDKGEESLEALLNDGFEYVKWDGRYVVRPCKASSAESLVGLRGP